MWRAAPRKRNSLILEEAALKEASRPGYSTRVDLLCSEIRILMISKRTRAHRKSTCSLQLHIMHNKGLSQNHF